ncbi:hypothetical protein EW145_g3527 [Phellinidium pouzarii]|uniref:Conserved oligomeric Golgi complex subunit 3 n=1 Tax=Phellinidium pouzarii TaxID=167371 RepID=A0A4S4LC37_9AGAM|nr:hypothetical protein EW145_g3527 [Phellinidium pouzarii]
MASSNSKGPVMQPSHPVISLEEWEAKAPLTELELRSVNAFQKACEEKPWPLKNSAGDGPPSRTASPVSKQKFYAQGSSSIPETPTLEEKPTQTFQHMRPDRPVQTTQEFYDWFSMIERSVAHSQESSYREHLSTIMKHLETCENLTGTVDQVQKEVDDMLDGWRSVEVGGKSLKDACEQLLDERDRLIRLSEDIGARLEYFQELEHATRMLNHPGESLVLQVDFLDMVERVDICIEFLRTHRHYRESETYLLRFQQCLTRAMTLIKMFFVGSLKALSTDISRRMSDREVSQTAQMHLLYTRFQSVAVQVAPLLGELERRARSHPDELSSFLAECHSAYFSARKTLLIGRLAEEIKGLDPSRADLVELTRAGCSYLKQLCIDEFSVYKCFFNSGKELLYAYLENLCDHLYDDLRPRILHEPRLSVLCDVCKVLQALMVLDVPEMEPSSDDEGESFSLGSLVGHDAKQGLGKLHISHMLQSVLQDAQTRLVFKAQTVVQADIRYYVPKSDDLNYPKILEDAPQRHNAFVIKERDDETPIFQVSSFNKRETWYTTLKTTITVLTQLHDFVQPLIFDDIAQEAIKLCRLSLMPAANMIATRGSASASLDSQLFLIRHLLVLKEMVNSMKLASHDADGPLEFRHVTDTLKDILRTSNLMPYAFASSLSKGRDEATGTGMREDIDSDLRRACEAVIQLCANTATQPIDDFMRTLDAVTSPGTGNEVKYEPPSRTAALSVEAAFREGLKREVPTAARILRLYLADSEENSGSKSIDGNKKNDLGRGTVAVLLGHVEERVVDAYITLCKAAEFMPTEEGSEGSVPVLNYCPPITPREGPNFQARSVHKYEDIRSQVSIQRSGMAHRVFVLWHSPASRARSQTYRKSASDTCSLAVFLGSGGHTSEALALVSTLDFLRYTPRKYILVGSPVTYEILVVPRARRVHQSLITTPPTAAWSLITSLRHMLQAPLISRRSFADVLLLNGPGTCFVLCIAVYTLRHITPANVYLKFFGLPSPRLIYVESFARVNSLSLSGKLLQHIVDRFIVQWPQLLKNGGRGDWRGWLV